MRRFFSLSAAFVPFPMVPKTKDHRAVGRKGGFKSLGSNLPANAYKGKVEKIKAGLIHNAKVKRTYHRTLKREEKSGFLPASLDSFRSPHTQEKLENADLQTLHPSRSEALTAPQSTNTKSPGKRTRRPPPLTKEEKLALAQKLKAEKEQAQRDREQKIKQRERTKRTFQKMTKRGQPVMKPRLEHLLTKVKRIMKED